MSNPKDSTGRLIYPFTLHYTAVHTNKRSALFGMTREDSLGFCTEADALHWVGRINAKEAKRSGSVGYRVTASRVWSER